MMAMRGFVESSLRSIIDFLIIKEQTHMTMLSFVSHFPGLAHFIYVDRLNFQVIAPVIVALVSDVGNGTVTVDGAAPTDPERRALHTTAYSVDQLRHKVWQMVFEAQTRLSQGYDLRSLHLRARYRAPGLTRWRGAFRSVRYTSMLMQAGDFQYSYTLWFEDSDGNRLGILHATCRRTRGLTVAAYVSVTHSLPLDRPIPSPSNSFTSTFYRYGRPKKGAARNAGGLTHCSLHCSFSNAAVQGHGTGALPDRAPGQLLRALHASPGRGAHAHRAGAEPAPRQEAPRKPVRAAHGALWQQRMRPQLL